MKFKYVFLNILFFNFAYNTYSQNLSNEEKKLYDLIMEYRNEKGLPIIRISSSLTHVAQLHVKDLSNNHPDQGICNMHSWSSNGPWSSCCYTSDHARAECMWSKPRELSNYKGNGYEISFGSFGTEATPESALNGWKSSSGHNAVIINQGIWNDRWNAIGIGLYKGYSVVWFGKEYDTQNEFKNTSNQSEKKESTQPIPIFNNQIVNSNSNTTIYKKKHKLLSLKLGGSINLLSEDFKSLGGTSINNELAYQINTMIGINLGKHKKNTSFGIFGNYGKYNSKNTTLLNNKAFLSKDDFIEIESGFLIKEFFRLSGGVGYSNFNSISFNSYNYSTITAGFSFGPRWIKMDVTNTLMKIRNNEKYFFRPSLGISIVLNTLNKKI